MAADQIPERDGQIIINSSESYSVHAWGYFCVVSDGPFGFWLNF